MQYCSFSKLRVNVKDDTMLIFRKIFILIHMDFLLADLMWNPPSRFLRGSTGFDWQEDQKPCCHLVSYHLPLDTSPKWDFISIPDTTEDATPNAQAETVRWWVKSGVRGNNALSAFFRGSIQAGKALGYTVQMDEKWSTSKNTDKALPWTQVKVHYRPLIAIFRADRNTEVGQGRLDLERHFYFWGGAGTDGH